MTCYCDRVVVSTADRDHSVGDVHQLWIKVVDIGISITSQLAVVHFTTCKQLTTLWQAMPSNTYTTTWPTRLIHVRPGYQGRTSRDWWSRFSRLDDFLLYNQDVKGLSTRQPSLITLTPYFYKTNIFGFLPWMAGLWRPFLPPTSVFNLSL